VLTEAELAKILPGVLSSAPITIALIDRERYVRHVNLVEHGFDRRAVRDIRLDSLLPPADRERIVGVIDEVFRTGLPGAYEAFLETPSGPVLYFVRVGALRIDGEVRYAVLASFDVTEEHQKRQLAEREHAMLVALERVNRIILSPFGSEPLLDRVLGEMLTLFDCERAFLAHPCDPEAKEFSVLYEQTLPTVPRLRGRTLPVDDAIAACFEQALRPQGVMRAPAEGNARATASASGSELDVRTLSFAAVRAEGDKPWLLAIQRKDGRSHDAEQSLLAAIAARVADFLRTWTAQLALRQSEEHFRLLTEHAPDAIVICDMETGKFVEVNRQAIELFGMPRERLLELGPLELSPATQADGAPSAERALRLLTAAVAGERPVFEWLHQHASGAPLECEVRLLHLPHPDHTWVRGSILQIADRKRAERENERLSAQLAQAQKMQAIGHLTGGVAHDFNNLLTVISGGLEMMELEARPDAALRSYGAMALDACRRAAALTQRLLAFSRQQPLRPRSVDIAQLLRGMEGLLARTLGETIHIEMACSGGLWTCEVDPAQLESAILNLSINARDAMPNGGRLTIEASNLRLEGSALLPDEELLPGDYVLLCVSDDGTGIEPALLSKVFDPFFTTKEVGKGSGLGLSMVYGFAKQSRGHVKIYSELGHGTSVKLFLPRSDRAAQPEPPREASDSGPRGRGELVLVVEDDPSLRALVVDLLRRLEYRTLAARDANGALELLRDTPDTALLLADMVLPGGLNGTQLGRRCTAMRPDLPVLFMSGYTENAVIHNGRLDEGVRLLEKPFTTSALAHAVRRALDEA
jgi:PAS domain S-box-containing protein